MTKGKINNKRDKTKTGFRSVYKKKTVIEGSVILIKEGVNLLVVNSKK